MRKLGVYALGYTRGDEFVIAYLGRADDDLKAERLRALACDSGAAARTGFEMYESSQTDIDSIPSEVAVEYHGISA